MPEKRTTVLSVGADFELVSLRNYVLQDAGFDVTSTLNEQEALARIERGECGVLLMCYSLPKEIRKNLAAALRRFWPASRVVLVVNEHIEKPDFADTFVYGVEGPEALIEAVASAAEKSRSAQA